MQYTYELLETEFGSTVLRSDGACVPIDPANSDYQRYLNPEAEHLNGIVDGNEQQTPGGTN